MKLEVFERLILLNILPKEGDFTTLKIIHDLKDSLSFTEEEHKELKFEHGTNNDIRWNIDADISKEIEIGDVAKNIIRETLEKLNKEKKLTEQHIPIYEKFVIGVTNG